MQILAQPIILVSFLVAADFPDETIPKGLAAEGLSNLTGLSGNSPNSWIGPARHALGHAFGLPEVAIVNPQAIMSTGYPQYPNCVLQQQEKDSLNISPFFKSTTYIEDKSFYCMDILCKRILQDCHQLYDWFFGLKEYQIIGNCFYSCPH